MSKLVGDIVRKAAIIAHVQHSEQFRADGYTPYIAHPAIVVRILRSHGIDSAPVLAAAWLHDTLEDTPATVESLRREGMPADVIQWVTTLTRSSEKNRDRRLHLLLTVARDYPPEVAAIKAADRIANLRDLRYANWTYGKAWRYIIESFLLYTRLPKTWEHSTLFAELALAIQDEARCAGRDMAEVTEEASCLEVRLVNGRQDPPLPPPPGSDAMTADGRFVSGPGYGGERM